MVPYALRGVPPTRHEGNRRDSGHTTSPGVIPGRKLVLVCRVAACLTENPRPRPLPVERCQRQGGSRSFGSMLPDGRRVLTLVNDRAHRAHRVCGRTAGPNNNNNKSDNQPSL